MRIIAKQGQTLLDLAIQHTGSIEGAILLAQQLGISITADIAIGTQFDEIPVTDKTVYKYFTDNKLEPASGVNSNSRLGGISLMGINIDFVVS